jgi:hypothetical protein
VEACWSQRFNSQGKEAHTPGDYACLNLNIFTTELEGRQSTKDPHRPFVTVSYEGDGSDQPDAKTAAKSVELLREFKAAGKPFLLAAGFVRPHYPMVAPRPFFDRYPHAKIEVPQVPENDLDDIPPLGISGSNSKKNGLAKFPENQQRMWSGYYAAVTFMDTQLGRILDELDALNFTLSQRHRAALYSGDPQMVETGVSRDENVAPTGREPVAGMVAGDLIGTTGCETVIGVRGGCSGSSSGSLFHGRMVSPTPASRSANGSSPPTCAKGVAWMGPDG